MAIFVAKDGPTVEYPGSRGGFLWVCLNMGNWERPKKNGTFDYRFLGKILENDEALDVGLS